MQEAADWIDQMEHVLGAIGRKTGTEWSTQIEAWRKTLGETP